MRILGETDSLSVAHGFTSLIFKRVIYSNMNPQLRKRSFFNSVVYPVEALKKKKNAIISDRTLLIFFSYIILTASYFAWIYP